MKICIIGAGTIGGGIAKRLEKVHTVNVQTKQNSKDLKKRIKDSDVIILAVKPHALADLVKEMGEVKGDKVIVSVLTGIDIRKLKGYFPDVSVVRMMPNLALTTGESVLGFAEGNYSLKVKKMLEGIFGLLGKSYWIPETKFDGLTALTGSGPAFVLVMIEAMVEAGIGLGFSHKQSLELVMQMMEGTLSVLKEGKHPAELKWQIATPGGTTIEGLKMLEDKGLRIAILEAFYAAAAKAKSMNKK